MAFVPVYILILGFTIVVDYFAAIFIEKEHGKKRRSFLIISLIANISILAIFKYYNFINENLTILLHGAGFRNPIPYLSILLPIGLSFHTFQAMSYTIEVYRGHQKAERSFGIYALYVMFFPQLVAGPIERPQNLLYQFRQKHDFNYDRITSGLRLIAWGLLKKVVIADRLAVVVDTVYKAPEKYNSISLIIATVFFAYQIFCDFSGYSNMAVGIARVLGFNLMNNFDNPYQSKSIQEFWKRWHISLSTWFRDYLYIPLGGNRVSTYRWHLNLFIVFLISGLWHGASWTFVIWGALHGFYLLLETFTQKLRNRLNIKYPPFFGTFFTFILVCFAWIFFRATSIHSALYIAENILKGIPEIIINLFNHALLIEKIGANKKELLFCLLLICSLETVHYLGTKINFGQIIKQKPVYIRWGIYFAILAIIINWGVFEDRQFIYFQF